MAAHRFSRINFSMPLQNRSDAASGITSASFPSGAPPLAVTFTDVLRAARTLDGVVHRTPVLTSRAADVRAGAHVFFKCESFQRAGAFKFRGAYNAISRLDDEQRRRGVVAFSSGNHAQAIALAARLLGVPATVVMPADAPAMKLAATRGYGAEVVLYDRAREDRDAIAQRIQHERGLALIPPYDHPDVIAGQGTAALELFDEVGELDFLFAPVGGGGLVSASSVVAAERSPGCRVFGVEPEAGNDAQQSLQRGEVVHIPLPDTIADGAQTQHIGVLVLPLLQRYVAGVVTVPDARLCATMRFMAERMKVVVEPTGALAAAAVLDRVVDLSGARVGVIVSGGNVDMSAFARFVTSDVARDQTV